MRRGLNLLSALREGHVHLWLARSVDLNNDRKRLASFLSDDERARAANYKLVAPRDQFVLARGWLRSTLAAYLNVSPETLCFGTTGNGKPILQHSERLYFNLSHTSQAIAIAIACDRPVGVDIEQIQARRSLEGIVKQQFHLDERSDYELADESDKLATFYRIWTCKEAYLKGLGTGFAQSLTSFAMRPMKERFVACPNLDEQAWSVISRIEGDCALAIAAPGDWQVELGTAKK